MNYQLNNNHNINNFNLNNFSSTTNNKSILDNLKYLLVSNNISSLDRSNNNCSNNVNNNNRSSTNYQNNNVNTINNQYSSSFLSNTNINYQLLNLQLSLLPIVNQILNKIVSDCLYSEQYLQQVLSTLEKTKSENE